MTESLNVIWIYLLFLFISICRSTGQIQCGTRPGHPETKRIIGGSSTTYVKWPWVVDLNLDGGITCGGVLVSNRYILTKAHCIDYVNEPSRYTFHVGNSRQEVQAQSFYLHPNFNGNTRDHDAILVKLTSDVTFADDVRPVCVLDSNANYTALTDCHIVGFGDINLSGGRSTDMQEAPLPLFTRDECNNFYAPISSDPPVLAESQVCAGYLAGGIGPCIGDGGAPLSCKQSDGTWAVAALVTFGAGCAQANFPTVFVKASSLYSNFVENAVAGLEPQSRSFDCLLDDEFPCNTGICLPYTWRCDNYNDCLDGSDEAFCGPSVKFFDPVYDKKFDDVPAAEFSGLTLDQCASNCTHSVEFLCHHFDYTISTSTCRLRSQDFQPVSLSSTAGTLFFQIQNFADCGDTFRETLFEVPRFSSPRYFNFESTMRRCPVTLETAPGSQVKVTFNHVVNHIDSPCDCKATLYIHDGPTTTEYCIDVMPSTFTASSNSVVVEWFTQRPQLSGFIGTFTGV